MPTQAAQFQFKKTSKFAKRKDDRTVSTKNKKPQKQSEQSFMTGFNPIAAKTCSQAKAIEAFYQGKHLMMFGHPGTGKTLIAVSLALEGVLNNKFEKVIIFRSAVPTRDIGFLPGDLREKMLAYERPYMDICSLLFQIKSQITPYYLLKNAGILQLESTSYLRGITLENCVVIIDECQNMNTHELYTLITRLGNNSRLIICGDEGQKDLVQELSGFDRLQYTLEKMPSFALIEYSVDDIVRSAFAKEFIKTWITYDEQVKTEFKTSSTNVGTNWRGSLVKFSSTTQDVCLAISQADSMPSSFTTGQHSERSILSDRR